MSLATWPVDSGTVTSIKPLPGTFNVLVTCSDGSLQIWDPAKGIALKKYPVLQAPAYDCSPSPDGKRVVVSGQAKNAKVVDIATGEILFDIGPHESVVAAAEWSPRGDVIALSSYSRVTGVMGVVADVTQPEEVAGLVGKTLERHGRIDVLINNVGIAGPTKAIEDTELSEWNDTLAGNLTSSFLCLRAVVPVMKKHGGGSVVNIG